MELVHEKPSRRPIQAGGDLNRKLRPTQAVDESQPRLFSRPARLTSRSSPQPVEQDRRKIALGKGRDDDDEVPALVLGPRSDDDRRLKCRTRRDADRHAFEASDEARIGDRVLVRDAHDLVVDRGVEDLWRKTGADALDLVRTGLAAGEHRRGFRLDGHDMHRGLALLQHLADAGDGAAGADAGNEYIDLATGVVPDFLSR